ADVEQLRPDSIAHAEDVAKDINEPLLTIEAEQHPRRASDARLIDHQLNVCRDGPRVRQIRVGCGVEPPAVVDKVQSILEVSALQIEDVIDRDSIDPGAKAASSFKRRELRRDLDQDLLRGVFRIMRPVQHSQNDVIDPRLVVPNQLFERGATAGLSVTDKLSLLGVSVSLVGKWVHDASPPVFFDTRGISL